MPLCRCGNSKCNDGLHIHCTTQAKCNDHLLTWDPCKKCVQSSWIAPSDCVPCDPLTLLICKKGQMNWGTVRQSAEPAVNNDQVLSCDAQGCLAFKRLNITTGGPMAVCCMHQFTTDAASPSLLISGIPNVPHCQIALTLCISANGTLDGVPQSEFFVNSLLVNGAVPDSCPPAPTGQCDSELARVHQFTILTDFLVPGTIQVDLQLSLFQFVCPGFEPPPAVITNSSVLVCAEPVNCCTITPF